MIPIMKLDDLKARAVSRTLSAPASLKVALARLGFVQADPIRAPARAQDLILRQRVDGYRAGDLERDYAALNIEEDLLYAYGFLTRPVWQLLHPRRATRLLELDKRVLAVVHSAGAVHPGELEAHFGRKRVLNDWGGYSQATKRALERLHYRGLLRIARRENGIRIYEPAPLPAKLLTPAARLQKLVMVVANILQPVSERTLQAIASQLRRKIPGGATVLRDLVKSGELEKQVVDGVGYLSPPSTEPVEVERRVRLLAPFDPLVWDRRRFEQLWGWSYRFEAYTPEARRVRGYYTLPLLFGDRVIGWANARVADKRLIVACGFVGKRPRERDFSRELDAEINRLEIFLGDQAGG